MNLLSRDGGRHVFHLTDRDRDALRLLLRIADDLGRGPARLTRQPDEPLPKEAPADFSGDMAGIHADRLTAATGWLDDPKRCIPGKGGFGLTLQPTETEDLLRAVNSAKVGAWEALGCPDFELGEGPDLKPENLRAIVALELAGPFLLVLLEALDGTD